MVDGGGLENRCTRKGIGGSNPSPSAKPSLVLAKRERELRLASDSNVVHRDHVSRCSDLHASAILTYQLACPWIVCVQKRAWSHAEAFRR